MPLPNTGLQAAFDMPLAKEKLNAVKSDGNVCDNIRLSTITCETRGAEWLNAFPIRTCGLQLNNEELRVNVALRLGSQKSY